MKSTRSASALWAPRMSPATPTTVSVRPGRPLNPAFREAARADQDVLGAVPVP